MSTSISSPGTGVRYTIRPLHGRLQYRLPIRIYARRFALLAFPSSLLSTIHETYISQHSATSAYLSMVLLRQTVYIGAICCPTPSHSMARSLVGTIADDGKVDANLLKDFDDLHTLCAGADAGELPGAPYAPYAAPVCPCTQKEDAKQL